MSVEAVFFDVGETLVDEEQAWRAVAANVGVRPHVLWAALGTVIADGLDHRDVWARVGVEPPGSVYRWQADDLFPDALDCLARCHAAGLLVGIAGNQPLALPEMLQDAGVTVDVVGSSAAWGVTKPDPAFFARIVAEAGLPPDRIAYVGDRVDNDVLPAAAAGMVAVHVRRGPWGLLQEPSPFASVVLADLWGLPDQLADLRPSTRSRSD